MVFYGILWYTTRAVKKKRFVLKLLQYYNFEITEELFEKYRV